MSCSLECRYDCCWVDSAARRGLRIRIPKPVKSNEWNEASGCYGFLVGTAGQRTKLDFPGLDQVWANTPFRENPEYTRSEEPIKFIRHIEGSWSSSEFRGSSAVEDS